MLGVLNNFWRLLFIACLLAAVVPSAALSEEMSFGPFKINTARPDTIELSGELDSGSALSFRRALAAAPTARLVILNSGGGLVSMGLLIADDVFTRKMATLIPQGSQCYSACSFVFLAGDERQVDGELGVHQISSDYPDLVSAQLSISDIIDTLNRFGTPMDVLTIMFRTPSADMHVFSPAEVTKYKINRRAGETPNAGTPPPVADGGHPPEEAPATAVPQSEQVQMPEIASAELNTAKLSAIENYARRPNRLAMYAGLDFAGRDLASVLADDAGACAKSCLSSPGGTCKAFTFNMTTPKSRGPNCFLKTEDGQPDGNAAALSGRFLSRADPAPRSYTVGVIDPRSGLHKDVDLTGSDLSARPYRGAANARECRLACVGNASCQAFTYVQSRKECWLKSGVGQPRSASGMISGLKTVTSFEPATVIDLQ